MGEHEFHPVTLEAAVDHNGIVHRVFVTRYRVSNSFMRFSWFCVQVYMAGRLAERCLVVNEAVTCLACIASE